jgi:hypothetical protein
VQEGQEQDQGHTIDTEVNWDKHKEAVQRGVTGRVWREGEANRGRGFASGNSTLDAAAKALRLFFVALKQRPAHLCHRFKNTNSTPHRQTTT